MDKKVSWRTEANLVKKENMAGVGMKTNDLIIPPDVLKKAEERTLRVKPLLESDSQQGFEISQSCLTSPRKFVDILDGHKALLIGDSNDSDRLQINDFGLFVKSLGLSDYPYIGGAAPRTSIECLGSRTSTNTLIHLPPFFILY